ncbi:MAG: hypothetical protein GY810_25365 [Aureispira sp.]|nr:hypothetical protein [Aureispira sp.]
MFSTTQVLYIIFISCAILHIAGFFYYIPTGINTQATRADMYWNALVYHKVSIVLALVWGLGQYWKLSDVVKMAKPSSEEILDVPIPIIKPKERKMLWPSINLLLASFFVCSPYLIEDIGIVVLTLIYAISWAIVPIVFEFDD